MIAHVVLWTNGMVMVFDEHGEQVPAYQGRLADVRDKILHDAGPEALFSHGGWNEWLDDSRGRTWFATATGHPEPR